MKLSALKPRFSIRALLVAMVLLSVYLTYHIQWVRQRQAEFASCYKWGGNDGRYITMHPRERPAEPFIFKLLGDLEYMVIGKEWEDDATWPEECERLMALFPGCDIWRIHSHH